MGNAIKYYLVARDKYANDVDIIRIFNMRSSSLEDIDLYTMLFNNAKELTKALNKVGVYDYFIVNQSKNYIKKQEVIYSNNYNLEAIALNSKNKKLSRSSEDIINIIKAYCKKMAYDDEYYMLNTNGRTNIYSKLIKYFTFSRYHSVEKIISSDGGWVKKSYPLIRNIVESFVSYHNNYEHTKDEINRELLNNKLKQLTDKDYNEDQISMFEEDPTNDKIIEVMTLFDNIDKIDENLPEVIKLLLNEYLKIKEKYLIADKAYEDRYYKELLIMQKRIITLLKNKELLDDTYNCCMMYNKSIEKVSGDNNGPSYTRKNK